MSKILKKIHYTLFLNIKISKEIQKKKEKGLRKTKTNWIDNRLIRSKNKTRRWWVIPLKWGKNNCQPGRITLKKINNLSVYIKFSP